MPAVASVGVFRTYKPLVLPSNYSVGVYGLSFSKSVGAFTPHRKNRPQARTHRRRACGLEGKGGGGRGGLGWGQTSGRRHASEI